MTLILPYPIAQQVAGITTPGHKLEPRPLKDWTFAVSSQVLQDPHHAVWLEQLNELDDRAIGSTEYGAGVGAPPSGLTNPVLPGTFTHSDVADLSFRVMMQARAPVNATESANTYAYWPLTDAASQQSLIHNPADGTIWGGKRWHFLWICGDTGGWNKRAELIHPEIKTTYDGAGYVCRHEFSSLAKAQLASRLQWLFSLGKPLGELQDMAAAGGVQFIAHATLAANPNQYFTQASVFGPGSWRVSRDIIYIPTWRICDAGGEGIVADYEVQDGRTEAQTTAYVEQFAQDCHDYGFKAYLYSNPLNAGVQQYSGIGDNVPDLHAAVDFMGPAVYARVPEGANGILQAYDNQMAMFGGSLNTSKIALTVGLGLYPNATSLSDMQGLNANITGDGIAMAMVWRYFAPQGGVTEVNDRFSALLFG